MKWLATKLNKAGVIQEDILRIITLCYLYTSSDLQLGQACHLVDVWDNIEKDLCDEFEPVELRDQFISEVPHISQSHLDWWSKHIDTSKEIDLIRTSSGTDWISSILLRCKLTSFSQPKQTKYDNFSQFLQYVTTNDVAGYVNNPQLLALKSLQTEGFLKSSEPPINRYVFTQGSKNRKHKTTTNPNTQPKFFFSELPKIVEHCLSHMRFPIRMRGPTP